MGLGLFPSSSTCASSQRRLFLREHAAIQASSSLLLARQILPPRSFSVAVPLLRSNGSRKQSELPELPPGFTWPVPPGSEDLPPPSNQSYWKKVLKPNFEHIYKDNYLDVSVNFPGTQTWPSMKYYNHMNSYIKNLEMPITNQNAITGYWKRFLKLYKEIDRIHLTLRRPNNERCYPDMMWQDSPLDLTVGEFKPKGHQPIEGQTQCFLYAQYGVWDKIARNLWASYCWDLAGNRTLTATQIDKISKQAMEQVFADLKGRVVVMVIHVHEEVEILVAPQCQLLLDYLTGQNMTKPRNIVPKPSRKYHWLNDADEIYRALTDAVEQGSNVVKSEEAAIQSRILAFKEGQRSTVLEGEKTKAQKASQPKKTAKYENSVAKTKALTPPRPKNATKYKNAVAPKMLCEPTAAVIRVPEKKKRWAQIATETWFLTASLACTTQATLKLSELLGN
ncbi:uncharacterized protein SPPG_00470 [Spizellomyces punctatus DAOM BR117]|uniref:Uncharacterized protein n=1 Tax=Spizellomyces punctatus (strain DAOM BR117) TaxID=645134 RepID=A0A0L0HUK0_SPIPD|nr:uncharacterized protein SPPG_00470 [Spizellomyces punctatus DAOM BR117]KND04767.1 hypothetical protein SPPG_00470 [Spizellomyces punctatus DAOM BR117]|eukprot:XP_016612806.1 hypothetical protein SPPG_00470 [Spizellomyces punctatus DAOM BR117]